MEQHEQAKPRWPFWIKTEMATVGERLGLGGDPWAKNMMPKLRERLKDPDYLPTHAEAMKIENFSEYSDAMGDHEILNRQYIAALGEHLASVAAGMVKPEGSPVLVVEVGAGTGRLANFLRQELQDRMGEGLSPSIEVIATTLDEGSSPAHDDIPPLPVLAPVELLSAEQALKRYAPDIVIASWPLFDDFDSLIQKQPSIKKIIVIGLEEACHLSRSADGWIAIPGFEMHELPEVKRFQVSRADTPAAIAARGSNASTCEYTRI